jgi:hypothetical protein
MVISSIRVRKNDSDTDEDLKKSGQLSAVRPGLVSYYYLV